MNQFPRMLIKSKLGLEYMLQFTATTEEGRKAAARGVARYATQLSAEDVRGARARARRHVKLDNSRNQVV